MIFSSVFFLWIFLPTVLLLYFSGSLLFRNDPQNRIKANNTLLLIASFVFYGLGGYRYLLLLFAVLIINFVGGLLIDKGIKPALFVTISLDIALLSFFKFADTFTDIILPLGISFYIFQSISYVVDVYRKNACVQKDFIKFSLYVSLFPQLVAGPIVKYSDIEKQLTSRNSSTDRFFDGMIRFCFGLGKKVLIANALAGPVDAIWNGKIEGYGAAVTWFGASCYILQLYFDFSGYSDMAIGLGRMLGFEFLENFRYPYISRSVTEFWRRWHISLGTWFRDYLYIPLGGNRRGLRRQLLNILIVWSLTGLWHGANWTFLLWGLYYAFFLILEKVFLLRYLKRSRVLGRVYTLMAAVFGWILFQLDSPGKVFAYWKAMLGLAGTGLAGAEDLYLARSFGSVLLISVLAATPLGKRIYDRFSPRVKGAVTPVLIITCLAVCTAYLVDATYNPFLYFRF